MHCITQVLKPGSFTGLLVGLVFLSWMLPVSVQASCTCDNYVSCNDPSWEYAVQCNPDGSPRSTPTPTPVLAQAPSQPAPEQYGPPAPSQPAPEQYGPPAPSAPSGGGTSRVTLQNPLSGINSIPDLLAAILQVFIIIAIPIIILFIILAGFKYVTARGNAGKIQEASQALLYAIIGGVLILGATAIAQIIKNLVNAFR